MPSARTVAAMSSISDEKYVSFTTFRRNGKGVPTPVWIADLDDGTVGFTTPSGSGKVKRIKSDTQVELQPCDMRGQVTDDATRHLGSAQVVEGEEFERVKAAITAKYGWAAKLIRLMNTITRRPGSDCAVVVTIDGTA